MIGTELADQVARALADAADVSTLRALESGAFPQAAWDALDALGLGAALVPEARGGAGLGFADVVPLLEATGRAAAPVPLAETIGAAALLAAAGIDPPPGVLTFAAARAPVPWGRHAAHVVLLDGAHVSLHDAASLTWTEGTNIAREPRDMPATSAPIAEGTLPNAWGADAARGVTALLRAAQIAGALQAALALAVDHANTRKQFGRPIGRFQAVQQQLAVFAAEASAASVAAAAAARAVDRRGLAEAAFEIGCAKVTAGEAAAKGAAIAHQVLAAMGITEEHALHHLTRRLWSWRDEGGSERFWSARIGTLIQGDRGPLWTFLTSRDQDISA
ncbi:acyl-CoA dehydrogenase family protein [Roseomonas sp. CECT 9278]|uniref:acyl-CoA dehydrogenase family protein n=1 Tax=Roseomonas sp. CECT 9278 TaxID=2845823 RepID=UPI001E30FB81|nr:acyl-CoA dehydrogenase family protein [Roseomonas sp. CECT 9278]CAH0303233.1 Crotonobetainyl-CoA reductase [Roseomonas sp. CECT 9278]